LAAGGERVLLVGTSQKKKTSPKEGPALVWGVNPDDRTLYGQVMNRRKTVWGEKVEVSDKRR